MTLADSVLDMDAVGVSDAEADIVSAIVLEGETVGVRDADDVGEVDDVIDTELDSEVDGEGLGEGEEGFDF